MKFQKGECLLVIHLKCALHHTRSKGISLSFFNCDNEIAHRPTKFVRREGMVLPGVGPCRNSLIGDTLLNPSHTTHSGRTPCAKSHSQISIRISLLMLLSPFFHYPCSDGEAVVINLKSDEAGKREQRRQGERERSDQQSGWQTREALACKKQKQARMYIRVRECMCVQIEDLDNGRRKE